MWRGHIYRELPVINLLRPNTTVPAYRDRAFPLMGMPVVVMRPVTGAGIEPSIRARS
jgi:hypothetical protein